MDKLVEAIRNKSRGEISEILDDAPHLSSETDSEGFTAMMLVVLNSEIPDADAKRMLETIRNAGGDPAWPHPKTGNNTLHFAAETGRYKCVEFLVDYIFETNAKNNQGETPLALAKDEKVREFLKMVGGTE